MHVLFVKDLRIDDNPNIHELRFIGASRYSGTATFGFNIPSAEEWPDFDKANYTVYINNTKTNQQLDVITYNEDDEVAIIADKSVMFPTFHISAYYTFYVKHIKSALPTIADTFDGYPKPTKRFARLFYECELLKSIPENLFVNNPDVTNFDRAFYWCESLESIPENLFVNNHATNNEIMIFFETFHLCSNVTGKLPELWITHPLSNCYACFAGCSKASNYAAAQAAGWA